MKPVSVDRGDQLVPARARRTTVVFQGGAGTVVADHWNPDGSRGALVMLHGGGQTRHSWDRAAALLGVLDWQVFTVDSRGHGDSQWAAGGDYSPDAFVGDLSGVVDQIGDLARVGVPPVLIGASLGGVTALMAEGESPGLARALVLVDVVSREGIEEFRQLIPASQVVDVAGATHMVAGDDNGVFVTHMTGFLDALPPAAGRR